MREKTILVVAQSFGPIPADVQRKLDRAGFIVLRGLPESVKTLQVITATQGDTILDAALAAIRDSMFDDVRQRFSRNLCNALAPEIVKKVTPVKR